ncbi:translocation/assembly module TamB domain-containing protein [Roseovarius sp. MMSF_3281]|uniref:translocation/assembly module TamB domain-containing protein n=1 Tax=Roseovarius sp. MMSF_3281 TaxID=3046694 RepID=UPI00273EC6A4|nr:translocation/assembly module TamB domain-containing protein [Roseovarius sp. MMSF_3281]
MRSLLIFISMLICLAAPAAAQDDDRGLIIGFLEDNLSDAGREVRIEGFRGALSSQATLDRLTIADDDGIWLELQNAELDWTRSALLSGRLNIDKLTAEAIILRRLPDDGGPSPADTEAREFNLPDLPVSINIGTLRIDEVTLAAPVLGEAAEFKFEGAMALDAGEGTAELAITRLDKPAELTLDAGFDNSSRELSIDLALSEAENGLLSRIINLPGQPAIDFTLAGNGPLDDYNAELALASDGVERFSGTIATMREADTATRRFSADLAGDLRPLFQPDLRPFFGQETALELRATRRDDGALSISRFRAESAAMDLRGEARIAADGWPEQFAVTGRIGTDDTPTRLPFSGQPTQIQNARITASYDKAQGEAWQAQVRVDNLENGPVVVRQAEFTAKGSLDSDAPRRFDADLITSLAGISHKDEALSRALGPSANAQARLAWREGQPLDILDLAAKAGDLTLYGAGRLKASGEGLPLSVNLRLEAPALGRFAPLANLPLEGAAMLTVIGNSDLLTGAFDGALFAETANLGLGNPTLDPLIAGEGRLILSALRDENGIAVDQLDLVTPEAQIRAIGHLSGQSGTLTLDADIRDLARADIPLEGPARLSTAIEWQKDSPLRLSNLNASVAQTTFNASGTFDPADDSLPVTGTARIDARNLAQFSRLAGRPLRGAARLSLEGLGRINDQTFDLTLDGDAQNLRTSIASLDALLTGGASQFSGRIAKGDGPIDLRALTVDTPGLTLSASGDGPGAPIDINARLADLARIAPGLSGAMTARGSVRILEDWARRMSLTLTADGPGGTRADISGRLEDYGASMDLQANGAAPLAFANRFIEPRAIQGTARYDLRLNGAPSLAALSGQITTENARATLPTYGVVIEGIDSRVNLTAGRANISVTGRSGAGGNLQVDGPITLAPPFQGTLSITLDGLRIVDPDLYRTSASGRMTLTGPLATAPRLQGTLRLDETSIRVPSSSPVSTRVLEGVNHINDSRTARQTRAKAGLGLGAEPDEARATSLSLDLTINAPNRIFVRGRGLDAELGGQLILRGSASDIAPSGQFRLIRGRFDILGKRLTLTEGQITLRGALDPYLRFVAETDAGEITARIIMEGLASAPEVSFTSSPELPQEEVIARLIFGRGLDKISGFQAAQLASAIATLRGGGPGILGTFRSELGLDDLDVTTTEDGATEVSAGSYISDNVYSEISADSDGRQQIELNLDVSRNVTVRGSASSDGNTGIGVFFEKDY